MKFRPLPVLVTLAAIAGSGLLHGLQTSRWEPTLALDEAAARLDAVNWWMRRYSKDRQSVTVILMCGRPGRMAVHTPEVCYQGAGYQISGSPARQPLYAGGPAAGDALWTARFVKQDADGMKYLRIFWAWTTAGTWQAPDNPRWTFRGEPFLYKLYVVRDSTGQQEAPANDPGLEFLRQASEEMRAALFPASKQ
jgi:hypothetical protein